MKDSIVRIGIAGVLCALLAACSPTESPTPEASSPTPSDTSASVMESTPPSPTPTPSPAPTGQSFLLATAERLGTPAMKVTASDGLEFGVGVDGVKVWLTAIVSDEGHAVGDLVTGHFTVRNEQGEILSNAKKSYRFWTGEGVIMSVLMKMPDDIEPAVAAVELSIEPKTDEIPSPEDQAPIEIVSRILSASKQNPTMAFNLHNPSDLTAMKSRLSVVCFDEQDRIIGGGEDSPPPIRPSQTLAVQMPLVVTGSPARCDHYLAVLMSQ